MIRETAIALTMLSCARDPGRVSGQSHRDFDVRGDGWAMRMRQSSGAELEGSLDISVSSNAFRLIFTVARANLVASHEVQAAIEEALASQGLTLDSAVVREIGNAAVQLLQRQEAPR